MVRQRLGIASRERAEAGRHALRSLRYTGLPENPLSRSKLLEATSASYPGVW